MLESIISSPPILKKVRADIRGMTAYSSARSIMEADEGMIFLDANESPYEPVPGVLGYSRYPSQQPEGLLRPLADL